MKHHYDDVKSLIIGTNDNENYSITETEEQIITDLRYNYNLILKSYKNLIEELNLKSPMEIFLVFSLLLKQGYLSHKKKFVRDDLEVRDIIIKDSLAGINIISGEGVCRHASALFSDIYKQVNILNKTHNCFLYKKNNKKKYYQMLNNYLFTVKELGFKNFTAFPFIELCANHTVLEVADKNYSYYLDSINDTILISKENKKSTLKSLRDYEILMESGKIKTNAFSEINEYKNQELKIKRLFEQNIDIFNKLYNDNKDIYDETNIKIRKLEKGRLY